MLIWNWGGETWEWAEPCANVLAHTPFPQDSACTGITHTPFPQDSACTGITELRVIDILIQT